MKDWFYGLDERERKFVLGAAVVIAIAILYGGIWLPLTKAETQVSASLETWQRALDQLRPLKGRMGRSGGSQISQQNLAQPLVVVVYSSLRIRRLNNSLKRSQPTGNNIRVEFENVSFDELMLWLGDLSAQYALQVQSGSFTMSANDEPGRVNAQMTLGR
jgi:general secretion pathway protein M